MPLTSKGSTILSAMQEKYGKEEGERVFYASRNKGTITGVDSDVVDLLRDGWSSGAFGDGKRTTRRNARGQEEGTWEEEDALLDAIAEDTWSPSARARRKSRDSIQLYDAIEIDDAAEVRITKDGYLTATPRVARTGIQLYRGHECGRDDMDMVRVYRPEDEVFHRDALKSFAHRPVTIDHPSVPVTAKNWKDLSRGQTGDPVLRDGNSIRVPMTLMDASAIEAYRAGKRQLSMGYDCDIDWTSGTTADGEEYDAVQRNIRANHLAVVKTARAGPDFRIGDNGNTGDHAMNMKTILVDGIQCEMTDTAAAIVDRAIRSLSDQIAAQTKAVKDKADELAAVVTKATTDAQAAAAVVATKDAEIATLKTQVKDAEVTPAKLDSLVKDRHETFSKAKTLLGDAAKFDGKSVADVRRMVVDAKLGDAAKGWTDEQVIASFNTLTAGVKMRDAATEAAHVFSLPHGPATLADGEAAKDAAYDAYVKGLNDAWMPPKVA